MPVAEQLLDADVEPVDPLDVALHALQEVEVAELVLDHHEHDAAVIEDGVPGELRDHHPRVAEGGVVVLRPREHALEGAEVEVVVPLGLVADVLPFEILQDQRRRERVAVADQV